MDDVCGNTIASKDDVMQWWSDIMRDDDVSMVQRLKASELIAKAYGMYRNVYVLPSDTVDNIGDDGLISMDLLSDAELARLAGWA